MKSKSPVAAQTSPSAVAPSIDLAARLRALYDLVGRSDYVFGSPLGPFHTADREFYLPRFVYFGPNTSQESIRLAVISGVERHDRLAANAVTALVESLARQADIGQSLNVSFFPVVNVVGHIGGAEERDLASESWAESTQPELVLLGRDVQRCGYQGFVRVVTTPDEMPSAWLRTVRSRITVR